MAFSVRKGGELRFSTLQQPHITLAETISGVKTMTGANVITHAPTGLKVQDSNASHLVTIAPGDESADRTLSIPVLGGADIVMTTGTAQIVSGAKTFSSAVLASANKGTAGTAVTAVEYGDGSYHKTVLTVDGATLPAITGDTAQGLGYLLYTMPATGAIAIHSAKMSLAITQSQGNISTDTPLGGLGSVIATGAVVNLTTPATFQDILTGQTFNDCNGTAEVKTVSNQPMVMEAGATNYVFFNVADAFDAAAGGDTGAALDGTVTLIWSFIG